MGFLLSIGPLHRVRPFKSLSIKGLSIKVDLEYRAQARDRQIGLLRSRMTPRLSG